MMFPFTAFIVTGVHPLGYIEHHNVMTFRFMMLLPVPSLPLDWTIGKTFDPKLPLC